MTRLQIPMMLMPDGRLLISVSFRKSRIAAAHIARSVSPLFQLDGVRRLAKRVENPSSMQRLRTPVLES